MSGGKGTVSEGLVVLAAIAVIVVGSFGIALGLTRMAGPVAPIGVGLALILLGVAILLVVLAYMRAKKEGPRSDPYGAYTSEDEGFRH